VRIWSTPQKLFDKLHQEFEFDWDLCADDDNAKLPKFILAKDSLAETWQDRGVCWLNPPYGKEIGPYLHKAVMSCGQGTMIVALVPGRTNAPWWHGCVMQAREIRFIRGKVPFAEKSGKNGGVPPYGSVLAIFYPWGNKLSTPPLCTSWNYRD
jgi:phage N-6-adenine-methyltransferase